MPYFVYKVHGQRTLERVDARDAYRDARKLARELRAGQSPGDEWTVRLIFAKDPPEAERLLTEKRDARPLGEE